MAFDFPRKIQDMLYIDPSLPVFKPYVPGVDVNNVRLYTYTRLVYINQNLRSTGDGFHLKLVTFFGCSTAAIKLTYSFTWVMRCIFLLHKNNVCSTFKFYISQLSFL